MQSIKTWVGVDVSAKTLAVERWRKNEEKARREFANDAAGHREEALSFARRAWDDREPPFILHARHLPEFRTLRTDPRFAAILREMNSP